MGKSRNVKWYDKEEMGNGKKRKGRNTRFVERRAKVKKKNNIRDDFEHDPRDNYYDSKSFYKERH